MGRLRPEKAAIPAERARAPPNAIVNQLAILPDIEKRLEGFVRLGHGIVVFPGGAGTAEEILYLIGTLWVTVLFNIPRNDALAALPPSSPEAPERWSDYLRTWTVWNHVRTAGGLAATVVLMLGLAES